MTTKKFITKDDLRRIRLKYGLDQVDAAKLVNTCRTTYNRWENGGRIPGSASQFFAMLDKYPEYFPVALELAGMVPIIEGVNNGE